MAKVKFVTRKRGSRYYGRKRQMAKYGAARSRMPKSIRQPVQFFKRTQYIQNGISIAPNPVPGFRFGVYSFNLAGVPQVTDFVTLYDQYKICLIKVALIPKWDSTEMSAGAGGTINNQTNVMSVLDYDDSNLPTSVDYLTQYQNLKITRGGRTHKRVFKPRQLRNVYRGALVADGYEVVKARWNDMTYQDVVHYGLKYGIQENATYGQQFDIKIDYYLAMKNVR